MVLVSGCRTGVQAMEYVENRGLSKAARIWIGVIGAGVLVLALITAVVVFMEMRTGRQLGRPIDIRNRLPITLVTAYDYGPVPVDEAGGTIFEYMYVYEIEGRARREFPTGVDSHDTVQSDIFLIPNSRLFCLIETDYPGRNIEVNVSINGVRQPTIKGRFDGGKCLGPLMPINVRYDEANPFPRTFGVKAGDEILIIVQYITYYESGGSIGSGTSSRFVVGDDLKLYRVLCENCRRSSAYDPYDP
jgi:hypothetical protein